MAPHQGHNFTRCLGGIRSCLCETFFVCDIFVFFSGDSSSPMVLCPVDCPAEVQVTTIFALRNGKIFEVGGCSPPPPYPHKFRPCPPQDPLLTIVSSSSSPSSSSCLVLSSLFAPEGGLGLTLGSVFACHLFKRGD